MRHLLQAADDGMVDMNGSFILAANRTARRDPLDHFNKYRGGWDIQNDHYWAVFTRLYPRAMLPSTLCLSEVV